LSTDLIVKIDAGNYHSLALTRSGFVFAWGSNLQGQILSTNQTRVSRPELIVGLQDVVKISAGGDFNLALTANGKLFGWGSNSAGQLALDQFEPQFSLREISLPQSISNIAAGSEHVLALTDTGKVYSWGQNDKLQLGRSEQGVIIVPGQVVSSSGVSVLESVIAIAAGKSHSLALLENGSVVAWGDNSLGQLGTNAIISQSRLPVFVQDNAGHLLESIKAIAAGENYSLAVDQNGKIYAWGDNSFGQLSGRQDGSHWSVLQNLAGTEISLAEPHIILDSQSAALNQGGVAYVGVRLSSQPEAPVTINIQVQSLEATIASGSQIEIRPDNWQSFQRITVSSNRGGAAGQGVLLFSADTMQSVSLATTINKSELKPARQVVGALSPDLILLLIVLLFATGIWRRKTLTCAKI
ncbi:MAG: hypothetical protein R3240_02830, partial [Gammaproteobacteria bacterium]|nr:hypothetical protein [Gammaproteobacteria bacterium]